MSLRVAIRTVAGSRVGMGHLRRCCTLAEQLEACGTATEFWIEGGNAAVAFARSAGFPASTIASETEKPGELHRAIRGTRPDAVVVDQYDLTAETLHEVRSSGALLCVIDDLGDRGTLEADLLVNGSPYAFDLPYCEPSSAVLLQGPRFALLGPGFRAASAHAIDRGSEEWKRAGRPKADQARIDPRSERARILVTLGGSDPQGWTWPIVRALRKHLPESEIDVVLGPMMSDESDPAATRIHRGLTDLLPLMCSVDVAVTAGGQTTYELAALGIPAIAVCAAPNQKRNIAALALLSTLEPAAGGDPDAVGAAAAALAFDPERRVRMAAAGPREFDGAGAKRVARILSHLARPRRRGRA